MQYTSQFLNSSSPVSWNSCPRSSVARQLGEWKFVCRCGSKQWKSSGESNRFVWKGCWRLSQLDGFSFININILFAGIRNEQKLAVSHLGRINFYGVFGRNEKVHTALSYSIRTSRSTSYNKEESAETQSVMLRWRRLPAVAVDTGSLCAIEWQIGIEMKQVRMERRWM